ncbi:MAG: hypothetical protein ABJE95_35735 [Byssovorax sp.]
MKPSGDIERRLADHIRENVPTGAGGQTPFYLLVRHPNKAVVVEQEKAGEARIECGLPDGALCVQWNLPTGLFQFLKMEKNADGALLLWRDDGSSDGLFEAHVMECKKTVDQSKWNQILQQLRWTFMRLRAISGVLGVPLRRVTFYTAYREDKLSSDSSRNPLLPRNAITSRFAKQDEEIDRPRQLQMDWQNDDVRLGDFDGRFAHTKIELDGLGNGATDLA